MAETTQKHGDRCERCTQHSGKICIVQVPPVSGRCVSVPQELPVCHRMSQKMARSGVNLFGLYRTHFITTAVSGFGCLAFFLFCFFLSSNLLGIFARQSCFQSVDGKSCGESRENRFGFCFLLLTCFCQSFIYCC